MLPGTVTAAASGLLGFDTDSVVTAATAAAFVAQGFRFCIRYVSRVARQNANDLSSAEALQLLDAGLALMPVQHVRGFGWSPNADLGASDGVHAAYHAFVIGFPAGVNVWCDLEGVAAGTPAQQVIDYCNGWYDAVAAAGYVPGIYVGADAILDGPTLRRDLKFTHYWKSLSRVPDIPGRGYQMVQSNEHNVNGISIDENRTQTDLLGDTVLWLAANGGV
ncbi:MAG: hypothetical protein C5B51_23310 [Terriglobia bacterium]|nr:MAG: hypothetical protein C5B51_23310 [Terriglobia bacterium]